MCNRFFVQLFQPLLFKVHAILRPQSAKDECWAALWIPHVPFMFLSCSSQAFSGYYVNGPAYETIPAATMQSPGLKLQQSRKGTSTNIKFMQQCRMKYIDDEILLELLRISQQLELFCELDDLSSHPRGHGNKDKAFLPGSNDEVQILRCRKYF